MRNSVLYTSSSSPSSSGLYSYKFNNSQISKSISCRNRISNCLSFNFSIKLIRFTHEEQKKMKIKLIRCFLTFPRLSKFNLFIFSRVSNLNFYHRASYIKSVSSYENFNVLLISHTHTHIHPESSAYLLISKLSFVLFLFFLTKKASMREQNAAKDWIRIVFKYQIAFDFRVSHDKQKK